MRMDMKTTNQERTPTAKARVVGCFFLGSTWQGFVEREAAGGGVVVQLFSWLDGCPTDQRTVSLDDMKTWDFFATHGEWIAAARAYFEKDTREAA
jgi:hypothetical protein